MKLCDDKETSVKRFQITEFTCAEFFSICLTLKPSL
jgi:hypothetical protein